MRFFASLDTSIYGVPYGAGVEVNTTGWSRRQLLECLSTGVIYPGSVTVGMITDRLTFTGEGVTVHTDVSGQTTVEIATVSKPLAFATDVADDDIAPAEGQALIFTNGQWDAKDLPPMPQNLSELQDVDFTDLPAEGQILVYTVTGWKAAWAAGSALGDLTDVAYDADTPTDGDIIVWDGVAQRWKNIAPNFVGEPGPVPFTLVGEWGAAITYSASPAPAAAVTYNGSTYVAIATSTNRQPDVYPGYWRLLAKKGDAGAKGDPGNKGDKGDKGDQGLRGPMGVIVPAGGTYSIHGQVRLMTGTKRLYNDTGVTLTVSAVRMAAGTAPVGADLIVDINKGGTTVYTFQGYRPKIVDGASTSLTTTGQSWTWESGTYLTLDVDQIGSTTPGSDVTITVICS